MIALSCAPFCASGASPSSSFLCAEVMQDDPGRTITTHGTSVTSNGNADTFMGLPS